MNSRKEVAEFRKEVAKSLRSIATRELESPTDRLDSLQEIGLQLCEVADTGSWTDPTFAKVREWCRWARQQKPYDRPYAICAWHVVEILISQGGELTPPPEDQGQILTGNVDPDFVRDAADGIADILDPPKKRVTVGEANQKLIELAAKDPGILENPTFRKYTALVDCSSGTVKKTKFWERLQTDKAAQAKPRVVSLTAKNEDIVMAATSEMERLMSQHKADAKLDPSSLSETNRQPRERKSL